MFIIINLSKQHTYMFSCKMLTKFLWHICFFKYQERYRVNKSPMDNLVVNVFFLSLHFNAVISAQVSSLSYAGTLESSLATISAALQTRSQPFKKRFKWTTCGPQGWTDLKNAQLWAFATISTVAEDCSCRFWNEISKQHSWK